MNIERNSNVTSHYVTSEIMPLCRCLAPLLYYLNYLVLTCCVRQSDSQPGLIISCQLSAV
jgi:hypothetical protein